LTNDDCEIVWIIKRLRNHARHDLDHGKPPEIQRKWLALDADLQRLGIPRTPPSEREFRQLQARLLERVEAFMMTMHDRIR
jgi:hypothetical protein